MMTFGKDNKGKGVRGGRRHFYEPHTAAGCLWRSVVVTLVLFAVYIIVGWIISG